jgi:hypothetical protein
MLPSRIAPVLFPLNFLLLAAGLVLPAPAKAEKDEWPPISPEELAMKDSTNNPGAPAIILFRRVVTDDRQKFESHYLRIKVFTEAGKKYADVEIPYFEERASVDEIRARTVRPDGRDAPFAGQIFDKLVIRGKGLKIQAKTFTLPDVQIGSILEYSYRVKWLRDMPDVLYHPGDYVIESPFTVPTAHWIVQHDLFTRRASFSILAIPTWRPAWGWTGPVRGSPRLTADGAMLLDLENIPGFEREEFMPPEDVLRSELDFFYKVGWIASQDEFWSYHARTLAEPIEKFMAKRKAMERAVLQIVSPSDPPEVKLRKLYARAQQVRALSYEHSRTEKEEKAENLKGNDNVEDVLKRGYARANEINYFFAALARSAGFDATAVEVAARDSSFFTPGSMNPDQLNAIVAWVKMGSEDLYLDPATRFCPFKFLPWEETGAGGIRLSKDVLGRDVYATTPPPVSADAVMQRKALLKLDEEGTVQGNIQVTYVGQEALQQRLENVSVDAAGRRKSLEDQVKSWLPPGATVELKNSPEWERSDGALFAEFRVKIQSFGVSTARRLLLPLAVFEAAEKYPFQNAKRRYPVYFSFPFQELDEVTLQVPEGYKVESVPEPRKQEFPFGKYEISRKAEGNVLRLERRLVIDRYLIPLEYYSALRFFYDSVRAGDEEQVVLKAPEAARKD